jgi:hypothetical protein
MKFQVYFLALGALVECAPQLGLGSGMSWPIVGRQDVKPLYRESAKRTILKYGPLDLVAKDVIGLLHNPYGRNELT